MANERDSFQDKDQTRKEQNRTCFFFLLKYDKTRIEKLISIKIGEMDQHLTIQRCCLKEPKTKSI